MKANHPNNLASAVRRLMLIGICLLTFVSPSLAQSVQWIPNTSIPSFATFPPSNAVLGGEEYGRPLYICRAKYQGGTHPGKIVERKCNIGYRSREIVLPNYEILVGGGNWATPGPDAYVAGLENGRPLYLCRAPSGTDLHPGKVVSGRCNITFGGKELDRPIYEMFYANLKSSGPEWVSREQADEADAVRGGEENGQPLYVCRVRGGDSIHPGKVVSGKCNVSYGNREISRSVYQVLVDSSKRSTWSDPRPNLEGAFVAGFENGSPLYLCRANYRGVHPGKIVAGKCNIAYGGKEMTFSVYEVFYASSSTTSPASRAELFMRGLCTDRIVEAGAEEVYILVFGRRSDGQTFVARWPEARPRQHYGHWAMSDVSLLPDNSNGASRCITGKSLFSGNIEPGQTWSVVGLVMEEDGRTTKPLQSVTAAALQGIGDPIAAKSTIGQTLKGLGYSADTDRFLGSFAVRITNNDRSVQAEWVSLVVSGTTSPDPEAPTNPRRREFPMYGGGVNYFGWFYIR